MLFNSLDFLIFFPIVVFLYFLVPRRAKYIWLLITSYYFYMSWNPKYALLILASTVLTWITGLGIDYCRRQGVAHSVRRQKRCFAACCIVNLGILVFFKYFDFLLDNINFVLHKLGAGIVEKPFDVILPVGISFYTFQALGYIIDV